MLKKLNLGCGVSIKEGYTNCDILPLEGVDEVFDITRGLLFDDDSIEEIICNYVLCQICDRKDFKFVMNECHRILCQNGVMRIKVGNANFPVAWNDPMDCRQFTKESFDYLNGEHYRFKAFNYGFKPWRILKIREINGGTSKKKDRLFVKMSPKK